MRRGNTQGTARACPAAILSAAAALAVTGCSASGTVPMARAAPARNPVVEISAVGGDQINPTTPITVRAIGGKLRGVTVTNPEGREVGGMPSGDGSGWRTNEPLGYDKNYAVTANAVAPNGQTVARHQTIHTLTPKAQANPEFAPAPGGAPSFGVGQPIVVRFNQRIENRAAAERALKVTVTPAQPGDWHWVSDREVHYRPENYWLPGTRVSLNARLYGVDLGGGVYGETDGTLNFSVHDSWVGVADGASHQMRIFHNGQMVNSMPISMGQPNMPTHAGPHVISAQQPQIDMNSCSYGVCPPNPNAYNEIESWDEQISADGEYVHENPDTVAQQGNADVSHGCINLNQANAQWFYQHFGQGDVVNVVNSGGPPLPITDTYGDWEIPWQVWHNGGGA